LNGNVETTLGLFRNTPPWVRLGRTGAVDTVNNWAELSGVTQFSAWTLSSTKNNTTTEITADTPDPSLINQSVTINFKVLSAVTGAPQVTGNVTITVNDASGDTCTGTINPADGTGTCSIAFTTAGAKTLTATYNGDDNFNTSTDTEPHVVDEPDVTVAVAPSSISEDGPTNLVYTFTREGPTTSALTVNFSVAGTAQSSTDYAVTGAATFDGTNGTITIPIGSSTAALTVDPTADSTVEPDETVIVNVTPGTNYDVGVPGSATGTITNDDTEVSVAVAPTSTAEDGVGNLVYTFTRTGVTTPALTVNFTIGGTATFNTDYTQTGAATFAPPNGTVQFAAGSSTATVTIDPTADTTVEPDETVILTVAAGTGYTVGAPSSATGTITNDDTDVSVAVAPASVAEDGATNLVYTFTRNGVTTGPLTVNFTIGGTATFNTDYTQTGAATFAPPNGTVTFGAGNSTATVTVDPTADNTSEPDETVILTVAAGAGYNVGAPNSATGTISNDDNVVVSVAVSPGAVNEDGATNLVYTFTRNDSTGALTANFTIGGTATFSTDYTQTGAATFAPPDGTVTFADGSLTATVTVDPVADITVEPDETVILTVAAGAGYGIGAPSSATGTITNDDTDISVAVAPASVLEDGAANLVYTFTRNGVTTGPLTVNFTIGGTATFNDDYTQTGAATFAPPNGTVTFGAGISTATVTVDPTVDGTTEPDETVILTVAAGAGYNVGAPSSATGTITNDDNVGVLVSVAVSPGAVNEDGVTNLVYTFTRNDSTGALTANFTIGGTATFSTDYTQTGAATFAPPNGTVTFADGSLTASVTVDPTADITVEPDETVVLTVVAGSGYSVGAPSSATGTITNDDTDVSVAVAPASVPEDGATNLVYTFTRNGVTSTPLTVNFTIGGTATFNTDYTQTGAATFAPPSGTVTFGAGNSTATVTVDPSTDATTEPDETVILTVAAGTGYNVGAPSSATGTITNDDNAVVVSVAVSPGAVNEDGVTNLVYTFTRNDSNGALTANFTIGGTATFNTDYTETGAATFAPPNGTVTFADGSLTATVTVDPTADITVEPDETVILTVVAGAGYSVGAPSSATGTITNDDTDVSVAVAPASVPEDGATNLVYTFTRNGVTATPLTVNFTIGGTATFAADYTQTGAATFAPPNGTVTFGAGNSIATVTVDPSAETTFETDETVILTVVAGAGYGVGAPSSATGTITNDDTPFAGVRLVITSALRCDGGNMINAVTISNRGDTTALNVQLTQAALQSPVQNGTPLPQSYGDIGPGVSVTRDVSFGSVSAGSRVLKLAGTYAGNLQFSGTQLVQIPNCAVVQSTPDMRNGTWASYGPRLDRLVSHEDDNPWSFLTISKEVPTSQAWLSAADWNVTDAELLLYWFTADSYFQRSAQQPGQLPVFEVTPWVSRISNNGNNEGVGR
jgi:acid phosphatase class B